SIPPHLKIKHNVGKYIVRQAFKTLLPPAIFRKKKQGFSAPEETWYRGKSYQYVKSILLSKRSLERGIFRRSFIHHVIEHHHRGLKNYRLLIWSLLSFEWWNRIFIDGEKVDTDSRPHA
ncbi:MAG: hypothetical protein HY420_01900, partial [Candidatus Kerfeldbacteria bacterium]|nr:hypothetical protein [Candidatus Kerfeldbacteria bacterium]